MKPPIRASSSILRSQAVRAGEVVDEVTLDHEDRYRRRAVLSCAGGLEVLLDLDKPARLEHGDALKLEDGRLGAVVAAAEELVEITSDNPARLLRGRLAPRQSSYDGGDHGRSDLLARPCARRDVRGLGLAVRPVTRAFRPERRSL